MIVISLSNSDGYNDDDAAAANCDAAVASAPVTGVVVDDDVVDNSWIYSQACNTYHNYSNKSILSKSSLLMFYLASKFDNFPVQTLYLPFKWIYII